MYSREKILKLTYYLVITKIFLLEVNEQLFRYLKIATDLWRW